MARRVNRKGHISVVKSIYEAEFDDQEDMENTIGSVRSLWDACILVTLEVMVT